MPTHASISASTAKITSTVISRRGRATESAITCCMVSISAVPWVRENCADLRFDCRDHRCGFAARANQQGGKRRGLLRLRQEQTGIRPDVESVVVNVGPDAHDLHFVAAGASQDTFKVLAVIGSLWGNWS